MQATEERLAGTELLGAAATTEQRLRRSPPAIPHHNLGRAQLFSALMSNYACCTNVKRSAASPLRTHKPKALRPSKSSRPLQKLFLEVF